MGGYGTRGGGGRRCRRGLTSNSICPVEQLYILLAVGPFARAPRSRARRCTVLHASQRHGTYTPTGHACVTSVHGMQTFPNPPKNYIVNTPYSQFFEQMPRARGHVVVTPCIPV